ncbi:TetR family transcriptional regulator [Rhodococcus triatomae BKS 15-14]|nr:TetR family transcriptional regulator [Rhodococcus triatomae BKS 15-14]
MIVLQASILDTMNPDDPRGRILSTADRLYYEKGYAAVGMDELRQAANVPLKRLYREFPSKAGLVLAVLEYKRERWERELAAYLDTRDTPRERLLAVYDYLHQWFCTDTFHGCGFINAYGELGRTDPGVASAVREQKAAFQETVDRLVAEIGGPPALATQLVLLAEGAQTTAAISGDPGAAEHARTAAQTLIDAAATSASG